MENNDQHQDRQDLMSPLSDADDTSTSLFYFTASDGITNDSSYHTVSECTCVDSSSGQITPVNEMDEEPKASGAEGGADGGHHPQSTTIGTIVVQGGPLQLVIAVLQLKEKLTRELLDNPPDGAFILVSECGDLLHIKVADIIPKLTFLGNNLDEALLLQRQHEDLYRQIQEMPSPISEFYHKVQEKIASNTRIDPNLVLDMAKNLEYIWQDILRILQLRRVIITYNVSFFEKLGQTYGKMSALEVACNDTMIVMETEAVKEFLEKFKTLRQEMLATVMETLSEGNQLLDQLYSLVNQGTLDSRPDFIKQDALSSVQKVEQWLEDLHDKRNNLEIAWQNRRAQLEQCLELTLLSKDLMEIEKQLNQRRNDILGGFTLGESELEADNLLAENKGLKQDAAALRDKALKVTKAVEAIVNNDFVAGEEVSKRAYTILSQCNEYLEEIGRREMLLEQGKHFFNRAEKVLESLEKQEIDILNLPLRPGSPNIIPTHIRMLDEIKDAVGEALNLGYSILDDVGPTKPEVFGVQKAIEKIESRNAHLENLCQINSEKYIKISEALNKFLEKHNEFFTWLEQQKTEKIIGGAINNMGNNLKEARDCLGSHSQFLADLEDKGNEINNLLGNLKSIVEFLDDNQRQDVDRKIESLRKNWIDLKNFVLARVDVIDSYIRFHEITEELEGSFKNLENDIRTLSNREGDVVDADWDKVRKEFAELKGQAKDFDGHVTRVSDPYLQTEAASSCIEKILNGFAKREADVTKEWENRNLKHEIEGILQEIIMANQETLSATSKIEAQLYPVFNTDQTNPDELILFLDQRLLSVETDIQFADNELAVRIEKLSKLESRDAETTQKIEHVRHSLHEIKHKLNEIRDTYKRLVSETQEFLRSVSESRQQIHTYFTDKPTVDEIGIELYSQEYEKFKYKTMESFRVLLQNSEVMIEKLKKQEPPGAKEHDTDRILTVLEQLRTYFEGLADQENAKIRKLQTLEDYKKTAQDIKSNIEDLDRQLDKLEGNYGDSSASAKAISLSFEYFERKIESLGKNIENLKNTSKNIIGTYPDLDAQVTGSANDLKHAWDELKEKAKKARKLIDLSIEYFNLIDQIETGYRRHSTYLVNMSALADQVNTPESGEHLSRELEKYINEHEQPQLEDLKKLAGMSQNIYNEDRTVPIHTDNITLFQQFHKLKADIDEKVEQLKEQEARKMEEERRALEEKMRQAELERQYKNLLDQIESATRRFNSYHANVQELAEGINSPESGEHLLDEIQKYIQGNEEPQMIDLGKLKEISMNAYGEDRSLPVNQENVNVFNGLRSLQNSLGDKVAQLKAIEAQKAEAERRALEEKMRQAELERDYHNLLDQIEAGYRRNQTYLINTGDLAQQVATPESGEHLSKEVGKYLSDNEPPQLSDLQKLSELSVKAFHEDRSLPIKTENVDLFDRLKGLKANIDNRVADLKEQERLKQEEERKALEEELKRKELERQYLNLLDQIDAAYRRHKNTLDNLCGLAENIKNPEAGQHLILELEKYLEETEQPQFNNLGNLAELSLKAYNEDRTEPMLANNVSVFEKLHNLRATIGDKIDELTAAEQDRLEREKRALEEKMRKSELERQYHNLLDQIETAYRQHNAYLNNVQNLVPQIRTPESGEHLSKELNKYICDSEQPQMDDLQKLSEMSNRIYGEDRTGQTHADNLVLFQNLHKIKGDIDQKVADLLEKEREKQEAQKKALEEKMRQAENERQYNNLVDQIEAATRRHHGYLANVKKLAEMIKTPEAGEHLARELEKYIGANEQPQWDDLKKLAEMSNTAYGEDRTGPLYNENIGLFEEFHKLKADIDTKVRGLREEEAAKMEAERLALEAMMKAAEDERAVLEEQRRKAEEQRRALEEQRKNEQAQLALLEEQRRQEEEERLALEEQRRREQAQLALLEQQRLKEQAERDRYEEERKRKELEHAAMEDQKRKEEAMRFASYEPPNFTEPLGDATVTEGDKFMFECHVKGFPEPTVQWYKDGVAIAKDSDYKTNYNNGVCTLQIDETFTADTAIFTCKASNSVGVAETAAKLFVRETSPEEVMTPPMFVKPLQSGTAREGASYVLRCIVSGNPLPTVQWFKNDINVDNSPDYIINYNNGEATLKIEEAFLEDQAVFKCKATNSSGTEETIAQLTVEPLEPTEVPFFRSPLSNVMARVGQKIRLECEVVGIPIPEVFWLHNDKPLTRADVKLHYENEKASLVINEAFLKDAGVYTITAKNIAGEVSSASSVCVKGKLPNETSDSEAVSDMEPIKPSVQLPLKNVAVFEAKPVRLDCVIIGVPEPEVIWYHNERPVKESQDVQLLFQGDRCSLVIHEAYLEDAGEYKVFAINSAGEASSHCTLSVTPLNLAEPAVRKPPEEKAVSTDIPPKFEKLLTDVLCVEGDFIELECTVFGSPTPEIKWCLNNKDVVEDQRVHTLVQADGVVRLKIEDARLDDKGVYTVKAVNSAGEAKCFAHLIVKPIVNAAETQTDTEPVEEKLVHPSFKELFADITVPEGGSAKFECIVMGRPAPKVKWLFNDQPVQGKEFLPSTSGDRQILFIPETSKATVGKISCVAENEVGRAVCIAYLTIVPSTLDVVPAQPPPQTTTNENNITNVTNITNVRNINEYITSTTNKVIENGDTKHSETHTKQAIHDQSIKRVGDEAPVVHETRHLDESRVIETPKPEEIPAIKEAKDVQDSIIATSGQISTGKPARKSMPPRLVTPFVGKIVDQHHDVVFEATFDGFPTPTLEITKNGNPLEQELGRVNISRDLNTVKIELKNVNVNDAGRYSCTVSNPAGSAGCTADLVVKKHVFPPVFCHRLSSTIVTVDERLNLEVTITGTPEPTVTWFKDDVPLNDANLSPFKLSKADNSHKLTIEHAQLSDAGKYMVRATNGGGEARSIADIVILEKAAPPEPVIHISAPPILPKQATTETAVQSVPLETQTDETQTPGKELKSTGVMAEADKAHQETNTEPKPELVTGGTQTLPDPEKVKKEELQIVPPGVPVEIMPPVPEPKQGLALETGEQDLQIVPPGIPIQVTPAVPTPEAKQGKALETAKQDLQIVPPGIPLQVTPAVPTPEAKQGKALETAEQDLQIVPPGIPLQVTPAVPTPEAKQGVAVETGNQDLQIVPPGIPLQVTPAVPTPVAKQGKALETAEQDLQIVPPGIPLQVTPAVPTPEAKQGKAVETAEQDLQIVPPGIPLQVTPAVPTPEAKQGKALETAEQDLQIVPPGIPLQVTPAVPTPEALQGKALETGEQDLQIVPPGIPLQVTPAVPTPEAKQGKALETAEQDLQIVPPGISLQVTPAVPTPEAKQGKALEKAEQDLQIVPPGITLQVTPAVPTPEAKQGKALEKAEQDLQIVPPGIPLQITPAVPTPEAKQGKALETAEQDLQIVPPGIPLQVTPAVPTPDAKQGVAVETGNQDLQIVPPGIPLQVTPAVPTPEAKQGKALETGKQDLQIVPPGIPLQVTPAVPTPEAKQGVAVETGNQDLQIVPPGIPLQVTPAVPTPEAKQGKALETAKQDLQIIPPGIPLQVTPPVPPPKPKQGINVQIVPPPNFTDFPTAIKLQSTLVQHQDSQSAQTTSTHRSTTIATQTSKTYTETTGTQSIASLPSMHEPASNRTSVAAASTQTTLPPYNKQYQFVQTAKESVLEFKEPILLPEPPKLQELSYNAAEKLSSEQHLVSHVQSSHETHEIKMTTQKLEPNVPLKVDVNTAVEYGFAPKPMTPQTPTKGVRLQGKIKALEEAQKEKGDVLVQGGIRVLPQMSVTEEKKQTVTNFEQHHEQKKIEIFEQREPLYPIPAEPFIPETFNTMQPVSQPFKVEPVPLSYAQLLETQAQRETPASSYEVSIPASSENEFEQHLSTTEKRHLFEQKILETQQVHPVQRPSEFVPLYDPETAVLEQEELQRMSLQAKRQMFEGKIREIEASTLPPLPHKADLTSPNVVRQIAERPLSQTEGLYLEPGTPPEILFAPQFERQVESHRMEKTVEQFEKRSSEHVVQPPKAPAKPRHEPVVVPSVQAGTEALFVQEKSQDFGYRHVQPPVHQRHEPVPQPKPQPPPPSHYEIPQEQIFKPIPQVKPVKQPPQPPQKPVQHSGYQADSEESRSRFIRSSHQQQQQQQQYQSTTTTHQKLVQHHHHSYKQYHSQQQQQQQLPTQPTAPPKLVKPIPINAATIPASTMNNVHTSHKITATSHQTNQAIQREIQQLEPMPFKPEAPRAKPSKVPPPPSPSKFIKGDFHESDYESDVSLHYPTRSQYKPVRPLLTPTAGGRSTLGRTPTPPTEFDRPPTFEGPPRPKFQPIEKQVETKPQKVVQPQVVRPKPMPAKPAPQVPVQTQHHHHQQQHHHEQHHHQQEQRHHRHHEEKVRREVYQSEPVTHTYYTAVAGVPQHLSNAVATETSKHMQMKESTEKSQRTVNVTHTRRVIALDDHHQTRHQEQKLEPFPYQPPPVSMRTRQRVPPPPTPTKFIPGEFRESDYESEVESARIRPLWTPNPFDEHDLRYRPVRPALHGGRATSVPRSYERVMTPMEFDHGPIMPSKIDVLAERDLYKTQTLDRSAAKKSKVKSKVTQDDITIRNKYGSYKTVAQNQVESMSSQFKNKAHQFIRDIAQDNQRHQSQPVVKRASSVQAGDRKPQVYRDEHRLSEYGTKHIDPDTGLIYFKYDFGYEFGIIFPGEGKRIVGGYRDCKSGGVTRNEISGAPSIRQAGDIEVPVLHEKSGLPNQSQLQDTQDRSKISKRHSLPAHFAGGEPPHINVQDNSWSQQHNLRTTPNTQVLFGNVVNQQEPEGPKRPPLFITPLKDIAAVSGQSARFECIVQCEPHPDIVWVKDGEYVQNTCRTVVEYRNGVCRLTIPQAYPVDAGQYSCTASNCLGSATTSAELIVPTGHHGKRGSGGFRK